jgi:hypothetical protein
MKNICGCGECDFCEKLTVELKSKLTPNERAYDRYVTRISKDADGDDE